MFLSQLLNLQAGRFRLRHAEREQDVPTVLLESRSKRCRCPACHLYSHRIHSTYHRYLKDLPCFALKTQIHLVAHKFYCRNPLCLRKIFTERFPAGIEPRQRRTQRLTERLLSLVRQLSSRRAEGLCSRLHIETSDTTLGRLLHNLPLQQVATPRVLGVDDWAQKKRNRYGTILVDLERHKIIDLLADRETATLQKWLEEHPGVQIVSRDRYTNYSNAIVTALPGCTQVVDRWHLLKNMCEGLQKLVERNHQHVKYVRRKEIKRLQKQSSSQWLRSLKKKPSKCTANYTRRWQQLRQIKRWQKKGMPIRSMAWQLGMSRNTVKKYLHLREPPFRRSIGQAGLSLFDAYIRRRIREQPHIKLIQLYGEIKQRGYKGAQSTAYEHLHRYVHRPPGSTVPRLPDLFYVPSKVAFLLLRKPAQLNSKERRLVSSLCAQCPEIKIAYGLAREFKEMMEQKKDHRLKRWMKKVQASGIGELKSFAKGLLWDFEAIKNAFAFHNDSKFLQKMLQLYLLSILSQPMPLLVHNEFRSSSI